MSSQKVFQAFTWHAHPARAHPGRAVGTTIAIVVISGLIFTLCFFDGLSLATSSIVGSAALAVLVIALNRFYFPSRFEFDDEKITAIHPLKRHDMQWNRVQRFLHDENGGYLSTRANRSRLDAFQGMHLLFEESRRDDIVRKIQSKITASRKSDD